MSIPTKPGWYWFSDKMWTDDEDRWIVIQVKYDWYGRKELTGYHGDLDIKLNHPNNIWGNRIPSNEELNKLKL